MKITDKLAQAHSAAKLPKATFSFEFFVPKTPQGVQNLYDRMDRMYELNPIFVDITWNAGGRLSSLTNEMVYTAQSILGLETCMHLTCTNMPVALIDEALDRAYKSGCQNILALRGDPPLDGSESTGDFKYAKDLITYIRKKYGDHFDIGVAAYPEGHPEETSGDRILEYLKEKCDAGANFIVTQMFYDVDNFIDWCSKIRKIGIDIPIVPGIMPISTYASLIRRAKWSEIKIPQHFLDALDPIKDDDYMVRQKGTELVAEMCEKLIQSGYVNHLHFYTMNLERATVMILEKLNLVEIVRESQVVTEAMPWRKSLHPERSKESIRPIFWQNRKYSYIMRTSAWDEFPNGRWGDARSPAFGDIDLCASELLRQSPKKALDLWGTPSTLKALEDLLVSYLEGGLTSLPWSDGPIGEETGVLIEDLVSINRKGFLTTNSQCAVNAAKSTDKLFGWGPKNGYVYQKQYLEFLCPKSLVDKLLKALDLFNSSDSEGNTHVITYYIVDKSGTLWTNTKEGDINAVTWGVFPCEEILQPTIVERTSFLAWKDEIFTLISEWATIYHRLMAKPSDGDNDQKQSQSQNQDDIENAYNFFNQLGDELVLCNLVNNNFTASNDILFSLLNNLET